ncbi:hypothetical protein GC169_09155 [bacterium]|nr:hypothetical protein [bacterium]
MTDHSTPNLPSRSFDATEAFYAALGFRRDYRDNGWMILNRGRLVLEFFAAQIDPRESWFSACLRVDDLDSLHADFVKAGVSEHDRDIPRMGAIRVEPHGIRIFYLIDPDGSLIRCLDNSYQP